MTLSPVAALGRYQILTSSGAMAYELLTGRLPFTAETPFAVVLKHVRDPLPPPSKVDPAVGAANERVLTRSLAKDPAQRYADSSRHRLAGCRCTSWNAKVPPPRAAPYHAVTPAEQPHECAGGGGGAGPMSLRRDRSDAIA